jgi:hemoglobin
VVSIRYEVDVEAPAAEVWDAVRDVGSVHRRLLPGRIADARMEGDVRILTFPDGHEVRELIVGVDDANRRLAYAVVGGSPMPLERHHASLEVLPRGGTGSRLVWVTDVLPHHLGAEVEARMRVGAHEMRSVLERHAGGLPSVHDAAGGAEGLLRLARAWHARVVADEVVGHAFGHGFHPEHDHRLAAYWAEALGGPAAFSGRYGDETSVVRMHSGNGPHEEMDQRAVACFDEALLDVGLADDDRLRQVLHDYFAWATTTTMSRYHRSADDVPDGLAVPRWSWDGLVDPTGAHDP